MEATHIVANPEDLVWLQMLDSFHFSGDYLKSGTYGRSSVGTVSNGKQVISTPLMPQGVRNEMNNNELLLKVA